MIYLMAYDDDDDDDDNDGGGCTDYDECADPADVCGPNSVCTNTVGSYTCHCLKGYYLIKRVCEGLW